MDQYNIDYTVIQSIETKISEVLKEVQDLRANVMSRTEAQAEIGQRVHVDTFNAKMANVDDKIKRLESGPRMFLAWAGAGVGCLSMLIAAAALVFGIVMAVVGRG